MVIRPERPEDFDAIDEVVAAAFERPNEAELVRLLGASDSYVPELSLVAEDDGEIGGHILLSYADLEGRGILSLAPLATRPDRQNDGIGRGLTRAALNKADDRQEPLVIVLGHPNYYPRCWVPAGTSARDRTAGPQPPGRDIHGREASRLQPEGPGTRRLPRGL